MEKPTDKAIRVGTPVAIDIAQGLAVARGIVTDALRDADGWLYRINITEGDRCDEHRNADGELWVCGFEIRPVST